MKNALRSIVLALALAVAGFNVPAAMGASLDDFKNKVPAELSGVVKKWSNVQDQGWWSATVSMFDQTVTMYLYWPDRDITKAPIVIVPLTNLNAKDVFDAIFKVPSELDVGLTAPLLFWVPDRFSVIDLARSAMPGEIPERARGWTHLPETVRMNPGLNLFGVVASGFLGDILKPVNLNANNLTAGLATGKDEKGTPVYVLSLLMSSEWKNPFGLDQTSISGGAIRVTKEKVGQSKTIETWGTVKLKGKDYTAYMRRDGSGLRESLAFDTKEATLQQFFDIVEVVSGTLGLPRIPVPSALPLDKVVLRNDAYVSKSDPASPPRFEKMMFMGSKGFFNDDPKLYINSAAYVFGWQAGAGYVKATRQGVDGSFGMKLPRIGPIEPSSGSFYLKADTSGSDQAMGINVKAPVFSDIDLKASSSGLKLLAEPSCPLRPFGFSADVTDLTKGDFPITPLISDCFGKALRGLVDGAEDIYKESVGLVKDVSDAAADTAEGLYKVASGSIDKFALKRSQAWGEELGKLRSVQDAAGDAGKAYQDALGRVEFLAKEIPILGTEIDRLTGQIDDLLKQVWKYLNPKTIWDQINGRKAERAQKISTRDDYRAEEPAAMTRRDDAKKILDKKTEEAAQFPSPYVSATIAGDQETLLGALSQAQVQAGIAEAMRDLPTQLGKDANSRKALFAQVGTADNPLGKHLDNARLASEDQFRTYKNLSDLVKAGGDQASGNLLSSAKKTLISQAVEAKVATETERLLSETVSTLPTMAYDIDVDIVLDELGKPEMCWGYIPDEERPGHLFWRVARCDSMDPAMRGFRFNRSGTLALSGQPCLYVSHTGGALNELFMAKVQCSGGGDDRKQLALFFFDPTDGLIRVVSKNPRMTCLGYAYSGQQKRPIIVGGPSERDHVSCNRFRLVERNMAVRKGPLAAGPRPASAALMQSFAAGRPNLPALDPGTRTNLAPLKLVPRKLH